MNKTKIYSLLVIGDQNDFLEINERLKNLKNIELQFLPEINSVKLHAKVFDLYFLKHSPQSKEEIKTLIDLDLYSTTPPIIIYTSQYDHEVALNVITFGASDYLPLDQFNEITIEKTIIYTIYRANEIKALLVNKIEAAIQDRLSTTEILASSLAHEIGTPLGIIRGRAEFMQLQTKESSFIQKNLETIISQIDRVSHLINSLLKISNGTDSESSNAYFAQDMIKEVIELLDYEFRKLNINFINDFENSDPTPLGSEVKHFHKVLMNVLMNSIQAIQSAREQGRTEQHSIKITKEIHNDFLRITVSDTGCGIHEAKLKNLFTPVFKTIDFDQNPGFGLAITHRIVESWGGKIEVTSKPDLGTQVSIQLPNKLKTKNISE